MYFPDSYSHGIFSFAASCMTWCVKFIRISILHELVYFSFLYLQLFCDAATSDAAVYDKYSKQECGFVVFDKWKVESVLFLGEETTFDFSVTYLNFKFSEHTAKYYPRFLPLLQKCKNICVDENKIVKIAFSMLRGM